VALIVCLLQTRVAVSIIVDEIANDVRLLCIFGDKQ